MAAARDGGGNMTSVYANGPDHIWTVGEALEELRNRLDQVLQCFHEVLKDEYQLDVLSLDSLRQMELLAEVARRSRELAAPTRSGSDFGATRRLLDTLVRVLQEADDPAQAEVQ